MNKKIITMFLVLISVMCGCSRNLTQSNNSNPVSYGSTAFEGPSTMGTSVEIDLDHEYLRWKSSYVTANGAEGNLRVIRPDRNNDTVSEGIAYGMLISVYMQDKTTFDGLWAYAKDHFNDRELMGWHYSNTGVALDQYDNPSEDGTHAASDADQDMALSLIVADSIWGDYSYDAVKLLKRIKHHEVKREEVLTPGDKWGGQDVVNPSYLAPGWYKLFKDYTGDDMWDDVAHKSYEILNASKASNGLVPDWCTEAGTVAAGFPNNYGYEACRTPWRVAVDQMWEANADALGYANQVVSFFEQIGTSNIVDGYNLNGTSYGSNQVASFVGPIACAALVSNTVGSTFKTEIVEKLVSLGATQNTTYYDDTLRMLSLLAVKGRFTRPVNFSIPYIEPDKQIALKVCNGQFVSAVNGGGSIVQAYGSQPGDWEKIKLIEFGDNKVALQALSGHYFSAYNGGGDVVYAYGEQVGDWELFSVIWLGRDMFVLKAPNGQFVCADGGGNGNLVANRDQYSAWETFRLYRYDSQNSLLLYTQGNGLFQINVDGSNVEQLRNDIAPQYEAFEFDKNSESIFIVQWDTADQLKQMSLDGSKAVEVYADGAPYGGQGVAIDLGQNKIFAGQYYGGLYYKDLDGTGGWINLVSASQLYPGVGIRGSLELDRINRHIYFRSVQNGATGTAGKKIWRVNYDGTGLTMIHDVTDIGMHVLDLVNQKIYFTDAVGPLAGNPFRVLRANLDGSNVEEMFVLPEPYESPQQMEIDAFNGKLYLTVTDIAGGTNAGSQVICVNLDGSSREVIANDPNGSQSNFYHIDMAL